MVAVSPGVTGTSLKVSVCSRGKVGRTVRVMAGDRRGGGIAGTFEVISDSLSDSSDPPEAPGTEDPRPGGRGGAERLPGKSVPVKPID